MSATAVKEINQWKENILNITMGTAYTDFVRNIFNKLGRIERRTSVNPDFICSIKTDGLLPEIVWKMIQYNGIKCEVEKTRIIYVNQNAIDFLGSIYDTADARDRSEVWYKLYIEALFFDIGGKYGTRVSFPYCRFSKTDEQAVLPSKVRASDVGYDLTAIKKVKDISKVTVMLDTGIIICPEVNYYAKIYPRSSLVKSGYMLTNSVGIIDGSFRDSLKICLTKIDPDAPEITFPFKCCQLIFEKQNYVMFEEMSEEEMTSTARDKGGFGSTDKLIIEKQLERKKM